MKNPILKLAVAAAIALSFACGGSSSDSVKVTGVTVAPASVSVEVNKTTTIAATVAPSNASNKKVTWTSSALDIATVSNTGVVSGKAVGGANITAKTEDGGFEATAVVTVTAAGAVAVTGVTVAPTTLDLALTAPTTGTLTATIAPATATNKNVTWASDDNAVATVAATGLDAVVTAHAVGTAHITVTTEDGGKVATCTVGVTASGIAVTGVTVAPKTADVTVNGTTTLTATVAPSNAADKSVTWTSGSPAIATVSNGVVTGVTVGTAIITVKTNDGNFIDTATINVISGGGGAPSGVYVGGGFGMVHNGAIAPDYNGYTVNAMALDSAGSLHVCGARNSGYTNAEPVYWKDGVRSTLPLSPTMAWAEPFGLRIIDGKVHIVGAQGQGNTVITAAHWVDGVADPVFTGFTNWMSEFWLNDICKANGALYVTGAGRRAATSVRGILVWNLNTGKAQSIASAGLPNGPGGDAIGFIDGELHVTARNFSLQKFTPDDDCTWLGSDASDDLGYCKGMEIVGGKRYVCANTWGNEGWDPIYWIDYDIYDLEIEWDYSEPERLFVATDGSVYVCGVTSDDDDTEVHPTMWKNGEVVDVPGWAGVAGNWEDDFSAFANAICVKP